MANSHLIIKDADSKNPIVLARDQKSMPIVVVSDSSPSAHSPALATLLDDSKAPLLKGKTFFELCEISLKNNVNTAINSFVQSMGYALPKEAVAFFQASSEKSFEEMCQLANPTFLIHAANYINFCYKSEDSAAYSVPKWYQKAITLLLETAKSTAESMIYSKMYWKMRVSCEVALGKVISCLKTSSFQSFKELHQYFYDHFYHNSPQEYKELVNHFFFYNNKLDINEKLINKQIVNYIFSVFTFGYNKADEKKDDVLDLFIDAFVDHDFYMELFCFHKDESSKSILPIPKYSEEYFSDAELWFEEEITALLALINNPNPQLAKKIQDNQFLKLCTYLLAAHPKIINRIVYYEIHKLVQESRFNYEKCNKKLDELRQAKDKIITEMDLCKCLTGGSKYLELETTRKRMYKSVDHILKKQIVSQPTPPDQKKKFSENLLVKSIDNKTPYHIKDFFLNKLSIKKGKKNKYIISVAKLIQSNYLSDNYNTKQKEFIFCEAELDKSIHAAIKIPGNDTQEKIVLSVIKILLENTGFLRRVIPASVPVPTPAQPASEPSQQPQHSARMKEAPPMVILNLKNQKQAIDNMMKTIEACFNEINQSGSKKAKKRYGQESSCKKRVDSFNQQLQKINLADETKLVEDKMTIETISRTLEEFAGELQGIQSQLQEACLESDADKNAKNTIEISINTDAILDIKPKSIHPEEKKQSNKQKRKQAKQEAQAANREQHKKKEQERQAEQKRQKEQEKQAEQKKQKEQTAQEKNKKSIYKQEEKKSSPVKLEARANSFFTKKKNNSKISQSLDAVLYNFINIGIALENLNQDIQDAKEVYDKSIYRCIQHFSLEFFMLQFIIALRSYKNSNHSIGQEELSEVRNLMVHQNLRNLDQKAWNKKIDNCLKTAKLYRDYIPQEEFNTMRKQPYETRSAFNNQQRILLLSALGIELSETVKFNLSASVPVLDDAITTFCRTPFYLEESKFHQDKKSNEDIDSKSAEALLSSFYLPLTKTLFQKISKNSLLAIEERFNYYYFEFAAISQLIVFVGELTKVISNKERKSFYQECISFRNELSHAKTKFSIDYATRIFKLLEKNKRFLTEEITANFDIQSYFGAVIPITPVAEEKTTIAHKK